MRCFFQVALAILCLAIPATAMAQARTPWRAVGPPLLRIGFGDDPLYQLDRVKAAMWLGAHGLVIANRGDELRFYDSGGRHRRTTGRSGDGPGEFRAITWLGPSRDSSVIAYDSR